MVMMMMVMVMIEEEEENWEQRREQGEANENEGETEEPTCHSLAPAIVLITSRGLHRMWPPRLHCVTRETEVQTVTCLRSPAGKSGASVCLALFLDKASVWKLSTPKIFWVSSLPTAPSTVLGTE